MSRCAEPPRERLYRSQSRLISSVSIVSPDVNSSPYHIVAVADEDAGYSDGRASVRRQGTKLLIAALIMHLPIHRRIQVAIVTKPALI
jgi:hypothetical protein